MADNSLFRALVGLLLAPLAFAQAPQITTGGVVSAASWGSPIAPGELIAIFGTNLAGGTSVTVNNVPAQVIFVSPTQVNVLVPASLPTMDPNLVAASVVVTTSAGSSKPEVAALAVSSPGLFTADSSGCGLAAALNIRPDGTVSINTPSNSAAPGDYVALFGTGFSTTPTPRIFLDNNALSSLSYAGPAPGLTGVEQVNFQIPASTRNGCSVPVSASQVFGSPKVTIAVQNGRGQCTDPPIQSYGTISLGDFFDAMFPAGPNVQPPAPEAIVFAPQWAISNLVGMAVLSPAPIYPRTCAVPGYTSLSAGAIQLQPPSGSAVTIPPLPLVSGVSYATFLSTGFLTPGTYTISGTFGSAVPLNTSIVVGSPIQITSIPAGTVISQSHALTVNWTGGDAISLVRVNLIASGVSLYSYASAAGGSLTIPPQELASLGPLGPFQITVSVVPATPKSLQLPGITGPVQLTWRYDYNFSGLTLGN